MPLPIRIRQGVPQEKIRQSHAAKVYPPERMVSRHIGEVHVIGGRLLRPDDSVTDHGDFIDDQEFGMELSTTVAQAEQQIKTTTHKST